MFAECRCGAPAPGDGHTRRMRAARNRSQPPARAAAHL
ncbi:hypothetical protein L839_2716 [Mycobacterium avium MAV_120809_2495]|nr:hypothetical protein L839_2716 [Mycobacterium avium MAV_120809_2495]